MGELDHLDDVVHFERGIESMQWFKKARYPHYGIVKNAEVKLEDQLAKARDPAYGEVSQWAKLGVSGSRGFWGLGEGQTLTSQNQFPITEQSK